MSIEDILKEVEISIPHLDELNPKVSSAKVSWHLDHLLQVCIRVIFVLQQSEPKNFKHQFNLLRNFILLIGFIPRGNGESPKSVSNVGEIRESDIKSLLVEAQKQTILLPSLPEKAHFDHPYFGMMNKRQSHRFLKIHSFHHLKIVRDILHSNGIKMKH